MEISIVLSDDRRVNPGRGVPVAQLSTVQEHIPKGRLYCHWLLGSPDDDINGVEVLITGKEYIVGHRRYDLEAGYALKAVLTPKFTIIPKLRKAVGKETQVIRDKNGLPICQYWPVVVRVWEEKAPTKDNHISASTFDFVEDAFKAMSDLTHLTEDFGLDEEEEDWEGENME